MPRVSTIDTARAVALYGEYGSVARVAEAVGASVSGVWRALKRAGVAMAGAAARMKALHADPEFKAKISKLSAARMKALHADPEFRAANAERMKARHADPEFRAAHAARHAERMKALNADPEFKARHAERMKALNADPEFKARHRAAIRRHFDGCEVPSWVPADLRDDYIDVARLSGEEVAASHVRRLKREAAL